MLTFRRLHRYQLVTDLLVAAFFGLLAGAVELLGTVDAGQVTGGVLTVAAFTGALCVRRLQPGLALGVAWVGAAVQMGFGMTPSPTDLAIFAVLYATAAYGSPRVFWSGFASALAGAVIVPVYLVGRGMSEPPTAEMWFVAGALLLGAGFALMLSWVSGALARTAMRAAANSRAQRAAEVEMIAEQQRVRVARDMHDVVAHSLAIVIAQADGARYAAAAHDGTVTSDALATISATARSALADVRLLLTQLRHSQSEGPQPTLADLDDLFDRMRAAGVVLDVVVDPVPPEEPPAAVQLAVYRILQEALTNALRHGGDPRVRVRLGWHVDRVEFTVRNARSTAVVASTTPTGGHGLIGMRERAMLVGGSLTAGPAYGEFVVTATLPVGTRG
ncbi:MULTISPECIES: sensor histidine kinase [Microbacterium]|uniref:sensor histidine kinase n=1 Tax=Microbacterium TaxID=33882 RepID=UPI0027872992|nr:MULTISPECIES: histidine kinase [Microbacterium]MDQ1082890.1 signal transduction histidine kinase [Microbacterium sp. SORGH_AS_0344]MDQ1168341.1 signal transduction histidine kinase [Microbacterium proteolyticum]